jgi:hypothetical protein
MIRARSLRLCCVFISWIINAIFLHAQESSRLVTQTIDETKLTGLHGNVHPLVQRRYDLGSVSREVPAKRVLLLLGRPAERDLGLSQYLNEVHGRGSQQYHHWLTPEQFGTRFGPSDSDIQVVCEWLSTKGFQTGRVSKAKTLIEFSGTIGQINDAFHTQIHRYAVNGELHYANASDPQIPEALSKIVRGISPLNDFYAKPNLRVPGHASFDPSSKQFTPEFTLSGPNGSLFGVGPEDFATEYDLAPLYAAGINGSGQTIGIINRSNIDLSLVNAYRALFKLPTNPPQVVVDGGDPGVNGNNPGFDEDAIEAYLDVELAGSVAPATTVNLYIASFDTVNDPLILAAQRAIEDNKADVLSISFGNCEQNLGTSHNQILNSLWQQAAAQGQTVFVSAGDSGSAGCDDPVTENLAGLGLAVSGFASTPWNIAVGGTDFFYQDYASGAPSTATLWNVTNDANNGSLKARLPEQVWNDSFGFDVMPSMFPLLAGSGGASSIYAKPSWQNAPGLPNDGHRDLPDVSLFAADGANLSAYAICASAGDCAADSNGRIPVSIVGGTSASSPAMAGIMALVNQKHGRQGQANFVLYPLARQFPAAFHDITLGGNNVPCLAGSPDCVIGTGTIETGRNTLSGYAAAKGYDLASGLGSVDASMLVENWGNITFLPSITTLQLSSTTFAHGTPVTLTADVTHNSASTSPSGNVSIQTNSPTPFNQTQSVLPIGSNGNASGSTDSLPGGSYEIWASYAGDGNYSGSTSSPVSLTVTPEASTVGISAVTLSPPVIPAANCVPSVGPGENAVASGSTVFPSTVLWLSANPIGKSGLSGATGSVAFTFDNLPPVSAALNVDGIATWNTPATATSGTHSVVASYSGDSSYNPSQSSAFTYTVKQGASSLAIGPAGICGTGTTCTAVAGDAVPMEVLLQAIGCIAPMGTVTLTLGSQSQTVKMSSEGSYADQVLTGVAEFSNLSPGNYPISATYSGDSNYQGATNNSFTLSVVAPSGTRVPTSTTISESKSTLELFQSETSFTVAVTGGSGSGTTPTGTVIVYANGSSVASIRLSPSGPNTASGIATSQLSTNFNFGANQITAVYTGDNTYQESVSSAIQLTVVETVANPDFTIAPSVPQFGLAKGGTANTSLNLASVFGFNGTVTLSCTPSDTSITCSVSPSSVNVNSSTTAQVTLMATSNGANAAVKTQSRGSAATLWLAGGSLMLGFLFFSSSRKTVHDSRLPITLGTSFLLLICIACGSGHNQVTNPRPPPPQSITLLNAHNIVVTGTANGIIHNAQVTVVVQ